ncbi:SpoIIE family protein phosphatase [Micromonospora fulviviridis]|uniref:SpoIIE family protein phosphatase n=1 Tax=Micromonospora fulviviridis TaxID=47860 RepID=A0ABV2VKB2_9ACTN
MTLLAASSLLGLRAGVTQRDHRVTLTPGCAVLLYTDGLIDRRDAVGPRRHDTARGGNSECG